MKTQELKEYFDFCEKIKKELEAKEKTAQEKAIITETKKRDMDLFNSCQIEKESMLKSILANLFKNNSVIIEGELSLRNGEFKRFRQHYSISLNEAKKIITEFANYLKLNEEELKVLDICLDLIHDEDYEGGWREVIRGLNDRFKSKGIDIPNTCLFQSQTNQIYQSKPSLINCSKIIVNPDGKVEFWNEQQTELTIENYNLLFYFFQEEIDNLNKEFDKEIQTELERTKKEIEILKEKCGKYLLVASLKKGER